MASDGSWGGLAAHDDDLAELYDGFDLLPEAGVNDVLDAFVASKRITIPSLVRLGTRLAAYRVLAFPFEGGIKYRDMESGRRWSATDSTFTKLKIVRAGAKPSDTVIIAEGETDGARLSLLYDVDVAVLPAGAKRWRTSFTEQLAPYGQVLVGLDNEEAGDEGAAKIAEAVAQAQRFAPPEGCNDWCAHEGDAPPIPAPPEPPEPALEWWQQPTAFDFDAEPDEPDWLVYRTIERGVVTSLSGDTGAAKSIAMQSLVPAGLNGEDWLGRSTHIERIVVIDEENARRLLHGRLRALGLTNARTGCGTSAARGSPSATAATRTTACASCWQRSSPTCSSSTRS